MAGLECLRRLVGEGIQCSYILINAVSYIMKEVCFCLKVTVVATVI